MTSSKLSARNLQLTFPTKNGQSFNIDCEVKDKGNLHKITILIKMIQLQNIYIISQNLSY